MTTALVLLCRSTRVRPAADHMPARRDIPGAGTYDKVVSCEMIEAVGHEHLACYFATINAMLKPGGRAAIQVSH